MKLDFAFDSCILCTAADATSWEHPIPDFIGGRLQIRALCDGCNNTVGHELVAQIKKDPQLRLALDQLRSRLPRIVKKALIGTRVVAKGPSDDPIIIELGKKRDAVRARENPDGTLLVDTRDAGRRIREILQKRGVDAPKIDEFVDLIAETPEDNPVDSGLGVAFVKHPLTGLEPDLTGDLVDDRLIAAMAFGIMATAFGNEILTDFFDPLRDWILGTGPQPENISVARWFAGEYQPRHVALMRASDSQIETQLQLLGVIYQLDLGGVVYEGPCPAYVEDLEHGESGFTVFDPQVPGG